MSAIRFEAVRKEFRPRRKCLRALDGIELAVADKEFVAVVGPSGCGKTTCLRLAAGFDPPRAGACWWAASR